MGVFWNPHDLLLLMGTEIFQTDASWAEKLMKTRISKIMAPTVCLSDCYVVEAPRLGPGHRSQCVEAAGGGAEEPRPDEPSPSCHCRATPGAGVTWTFLQ